MTANQSTNSKNESDDLERSEKCTSENRAKCCRQCTSQLRMTYCLPSSSPCYFGSILVFVFFTQGPNLCRLHKSDFKSRVDFSKRFVLGWTGRSTGIDALAAARESLWRVHYRHRPAYSYNGKGAAASDRMRGCRSRKS